uniref:Uncharacterized protein n=1 Tax=Desertifilum tharense IPPAS B-1220 TaxID=1781255 RepID=A0ACD5GSU9_9CYAN
MGVRSWGRRGWGKRRNCRLTLIDFSAIGTPFPLSTQHSALSTQHSALSTQHSLKIAMLNQEAR